VPSFGGGRGIYLRDAGQIASPAAVGGVVVGVQVRPLFEHARERTAEELEAALAFDLDLDLRCAAPWVETPAKLQLMSGAGIVGARPQSFNVKIDAADLAPGAHVADDDVSDVSFSPAKSPPPEKPTLFKARTPRLYDDAVPIRKKVAAKALPPGALLWLYCVEVDKKDALAEFEEQLIRKLDKSIFGFAVTKPFQGGKRLSFSAIAATKADLEAYRTRVLNPLLKTIPVKTVPYDDIAPICGYNDAEPEDGDCVIS
jgi:hypothetical protein